MIDGIDICKFIHVMNLKTMKSEAVNISAIDSIERRKDGSAVIYYSKNKHGSSKLSYDAIMNSMDSNNLFL